MFRFRQPASVLVLVAACAPSRSEAPPRPLLQLAPIESAREASTALRAHRVFADHVGPGSLVAIDHDGFRLRVARPSAWTALGARKLAARAPAHASAALRLAPADDEDAWIELAARDLGAAKGVVVDNTVVYPAAAAGVAVVHVLEPTRHEELRVLDSPRPIEKVSWRLTTSARVATVRDDGDRFLVLDHADHVLLETKPLFAIDARGQRRALSVRAERVDDGSWALEATLDTRALVSPIVVDPIWVAPVDCTGGKCMTSPRRWHSAATLATGSILIAGGLTSTTPLSTAEIFSPSTSTFAATGSLTRYRNTAAMIRLTSGKVVVAGSGGSDRTSASELYDPASSTFGPTGNLVAMLDGPDGFALASGGALIIGGDGTSSSNTDVEVFDPTAKTWSAAATAPAAGGTQTQLTDGRIVRLSSFRTDVFDPTTGTWSASAAPPSYYAVNRSAVVALPGNRALLIGGDKFGVLVGDSAVLDVAAGTWTPVGTMPTPRYVPPAIALPNGLVLVVGGRDVTLDSIASVDALDPSTGVWSSAGMLSVDRAYATVSALSGGRVLVAGGSSNAAVLSTAEIYTPLANGTACTGAGECASGKCVDGVCCDRACSGTCESCKVTGSVGTCRGLTGAPHAGRSCGAYATCTAGACDTSCTSDANCATDRYCVAGACVPKKDRGVACSAARECQSGACTDGLCCDGACTGQCEACDVVGKEGTCWPATGKPHGARTPCATDLPDPTCGRICDGVDRTRCNIAATTRACSLNACNAGSETHASYCDGLGKCADAAKPCGAYACGTTACLVSCAARTDCAAGYGCKAGKCVAFEGLGSACTDSSSCADGTFCTDGICCGVAACAAGSACTKTTSGAECLGKNGSTCTAASECISGQCVDSVCCDRACGGQCEACDLAEKRGTCTPTTGKPHGARPACASGGADTCAATSCDGVDPTTCAKKVGAETECRPASCVDGTSTSRGTCDGTGKCSAPVVVSCGAFACDAITLSCRTTCATSLDCAPGNTCDKGACVAKAGVCSEDGRELIASDGKRSACSPYACRDDRCQTACESSTDCAVGFLCDLTAKTCSPLPTGGGESSDSGGCTFGTKTAPGSGVFVLIALALLARRRARLAALALVAIGCSPAPRAEETRAPSELAADPVMFARVDRATRSNLPANVTLPSRASDPAVLRDPSRDGAWISIAAATDPVEARSEGAVRRYPGVARDTDALLLGDEGGLEDLRVLRSKNAPAVFRYQLALGSALSFARIRAGLVEVIDRDGRVAFRADRPYASDARGVRYALASTLSATASGYSLELILDAPDATYPVIVDPAWSLVPALSVARDATTIATLSTGKILIAGGFSGSMSSIVDLFDPSTGSTSPGAPLLAPRASGFAFVLPSNKVLVCCGVLSSAELYDPTSSSWSATGSLSGVHTSSARAIKLTNGKILFHHYDSASDDRADVYDPTTGLWTKTLAYTMVRNAATIAPLPGGRAILIGGEVGPMVSTTEIYDSATNAWTASAPLAAVRESARAIALSDGRVLLSGGKSSPGPISLSFYLSSAEIFDPVAARWTSVGSMVAKRTTHEMTLMPSGKVLVTGGIAGITSLSSSELFDPTTGSFSALPNMAYARWGHGTTIAPSGAAVISGGQGRSVTTVEVFSPLSLGASCTLPSECQSGFCVDSVCCSQSACSTGLSCGLGSKKGTCTRPNGDACTSATQCGSNLCVDGTCCDSACTGQCEACDVATKLGTCSPVSGGSRGTRAPCADGGGDPCGVKVCDGSDRTKCNYKPAGSVACGKTACASGVETHASTCNGSGACSDTPVSCGVYACGTTACNTTCATAADCVAGHYCKSSVCTPLEGLGKACTSTSGCTKGLTCVDAVCCAASSCPDGTCAAPGHEGTCAIKPGGKCTLDAECATGHCADSVCCDTACNGLCEACDATGLVGTCSPIKGTPKHGSCPTGDGPCGARLCDGIDRASCAGFVGPEVTCRKPLCAASRAVPGATCDGKGACPATTPVDCGAYVCDPAGEKCLTTCATTADCSMGYECAAGSCKTATATCSDDESSVVVPGGGSRRCYPLKCRAGDCLTQCATTSDCATGFACDTSSKACVPSVPPAAEESGGCAIGRSASNDGAAWIWAIALLAGWRGRARRLRSAAARNFHCAREDRRCGVSSV